MLLFNMKRYISFFYKKNETQLLRTSYLFGGDEGFRTPVQAYKITSFYKFSSLKSFNINKMRKQVLLIRANLILRHSQSTNGMRRSIFFMSPL